nr:MAG TPA_asm: hypothetical protein [Caudoviricetes sp.]
MLLYLIVVIFNSSGQDMVLIKRTPCTDQSKQGVISNL